MYGSAWEADQYLSDQIMAQRGETMGENCRATAVRLIVSPNGEGPLVASWLIRATEGRRRAGAAHALTTPQVCSNRVLTGGGRKNVVAEEAVPRGGERAG